MRLIRHPQDFWSGVLFAGIGSFTVVYATRYTLGTAARMGPGYFPRILGLLLIGLGALLVLRSLKLAGPPIPGWQWRPTVVVLGSVVVFGLVVSRVGLLLSTVFLIVVASMASRESRPRESIAAGVALAILAVAVFVVGLGVQLPILPFDLDLRQLPLLRR